MSGKRFFLDTNTIVQTLAGNKDIHRIISEAEYIATSVICELEFLAFPKLSRKDKTLLQQFLKKIDVIDLSTNDDLLKSKIISIRQKKILRLPDAIIAASAQLNSCILLTADKSLLNHPELETLKYNLSL